MNQPVYPEFFIGVSTVFDPSSTSVKHITQLARHRDQLPKDCSYVVVVKGASFHFDTLGVAKIIAEGLSYHTTEEILIEDNRK